MAAVVTKAFAFIFIIILGYVLKKTRLFSPDDYQIVAKITLNITLPAAVITSFSNFKQDNSLFLLVLFGFGLNVIMLLFGYLISLRKSNSDKAFFMLNTPGYNIGAFTLPFVQSFLGAAGVVSACMFDVGNSFMCTGMSYAVTSGVLGTAEDDASRLKQVMKRLFSSTPFVVYMLMLILAVFSIHLPLAVVTVTSTIGAANGFMAMLMIGLMFDINLKPGYFKSAAATLFIRYAAAAAIAALFYFGTPFSHEIRLALAIVSFAPPSVLSPVFTERCGGDVGLSSFLNSISIIISVLIITILLLVL